MSVTITREPRRSLTMMIQVVMILRVYAMYNRSRIILGVLLVMYIAELVMLFVSSSIYSDPNYVIGTH